MKQRRIFGCSRSSAYSRWSGRRVPAMTNGRRVATPAPATGGAVSTATRSSSAASRSRRAHRSPSGTLLAISGDTALARPGQPGWRDAGHRLPGRDARRDLTGQLARPRPSNSRNEDDLVLGRGWPGGRHGARRRPVDRRGHRDQLLERGARRGRHDPVRQGHPVVLAVEHEPRTDVGGGAPALLPAHRAQRQDPGRDRVRLRVHGAGASPRPPRSTTRARTPTAWPRRSARTSRRRAARSRRSRRSTAPTPTSSRS